MSVSDNEFDFDAEATPTPAPPVRGARSAKKAVAPGSVEPAAAPEPGVAELMAELRAMKQELEAAKISQAHAAQSAAPTQYFQTATNGTFGGAYTGNAQFVPKGVDGVTSAMLNADPPKSEGTLIHFIDDGFTVGNRVFYRGEEFKLPEELAKLTPSQQTARWGHPYFRLGEWDGDTFDYTDPALSEADKAKLREIELRKKQQRQAA